MSTPSTTRMTTEPERTLADIATRDGVFSIIAMDQRNTLRRMFSAVGIVATDDDLITAKTDVARALTPLASGILFDPTYGVPGGHGHRRARRYVRPAGRLRARRTRQAGRGADHAPRPRPGLEVGVIAGRRRQ